MNIQRSLSKVKSEKERVLQILEGRVTRQSSRLSNQTNGTQPPKKDLKPVSLSAINFTGKTHFVTSFEDCACLCDQILTRIVNSPVEEVPIGFDLEWPFSFSGPPGKTALAQLCVSEQTVHLFHIYALRKLPVALIAVLTHPKVRLVGVNIKNDVRKLARDFPEVPDQQIIDNNCIDCGPLTNQIYHRSGRWSMARLTEYILHKKINKSPSVRNSRWHILPLSDEQKHYAATDAYVSLLLYLTIRKKEEELSRKEQEENAIVTIDCT